MALLDRAGRVLSRIFGFRQAARQQAQRTIAESRLDKHTKHDRDTLRKAQEVREAKLRRAGIDSPEARRLARLRELGITPAPEVDRERRLRELGIEEIDFNPWEEPTEEEAGPYAPAWIPVSSSNVEKMRWVGGNWGLQVGFRNGYLYEYAVGHSVYLEMLESGSKGSFVWWMRRSGVAYRRWNPKTIPPRIIYRWGHIGGPTPESQYERPPQGNSRGPRQYDPNLGRPG